MKEYGQKNLEIQEISRSMKTPNDRISGSHADDLETPVYKPHALQGLSHRVEECLRKQRELNFMAREVSSVIKKLK